MSHVHKHRGVCCNLVGMGDRLVTGEVRWVTADSKKIKDQRAHACDGIKGLRGYQRDIGAVGKRKEASPVTTIERVDEPSDDGKVPMQESHCGHAQSVAGDRLERGHWACHEIGNERIIGVAVRLEDVLIDARELVDCGWLCEEFDWHLHDCVVAAYLIEPPDVIDVRVGDEDRITPRYSTSERLHAVIWRNIEQPKTVDAIWVTKSKCRARAQSLIAWVVRSTRLARAADHRDARTRPSAEQFESRV